MTINGYTFDEDHPIGKGGMGCVYKGTSPNGETVAIKMMDNQYCFDPYVRQCFYNEVESLKGLHHPSVVGIRGQAFKDSHGNLYMPMEFVDGETIQQRVNRTGPFDEKIARTMMSKILSAFSYIHDSGKVHRDIKPSNIMIRPNGEICVIDFGIVKDMNTSTGHTVGTIVGTDGYMSPEQVTATNIDHRTDIYSLGCLLHYMLTGKDAILKKSNDETRTSILNDAFPSAKQLRPELSDEIQSIIFKAVEKNMTKRYQTAEEFDQAISGRTRVVGAYVTVGRDERCDIVFNDMENNDVSRRHLTIRYKHICDEPIIEIEDDSTNGTGIDGQRLLHKGSMSFPFDLSKVTVSFDYGGQEAEVHYLDGGTQRLPEVYLAAKSKYKLDWDEVFVKLYERIPEEFAEVGNPPPLPTENKLTTGLSILSFLFPIVGWILSSTMKKNASKAAKSAGELGWIGFFIIYVILPITILLLFLSK